MTLKSLVSLFLIQWHYQSSFGQCPPAAFSGLEPTDCYTLPLPKMSWWDAEQACWNVSGDFISIHDATVNNFIHSMTGNLATDFWAGASNVMNGKWQWSDETPFNYTNWQAGYEVIMKQRCLAIQPSSGKWLKQLCNEEKPFMCKVPAIQRHQPSSPPAVPVATCPTPVPCPPVPSCPQQEEPTTLSCPACPSTPTVPLTCPPPAPVLTCPPPQPAPTCAQAPPCPPQLPPPTCPPPPQPSSPSCPSGFTSCSGSNFCYQVVDGYFTAAQAEYQCQLLGGNLATIDSWSATECLIDLTNPISNGAPESWTRVWIGLIDISQDPHHTKDSLWTWLDGSAYFNNNYHNWDPTYNEPNNLAGAEWCVDAHTNVAGGCCPAGTWNDEDCSVTKPAFCSVPLLNN
jgi:hypothetical protein